MITEMAYKQKLAIDRDLLAARQMASQICHLLRDFIPEACFRDALDRVTEAAIKEGVELTTTAMRKEYEAWKSMQIETMRAHPTVPRL